MNFTDQEKIAIVSLLIEMANADQRIAYEEMITLNLICQKLEIDHNSFVVGHGLKCEHAIEILKTINDEKKKELAKLMVDIIDSDNQVDDTEIKLLNYACKKIGIDLLFWFFNSFVVKNWAFAQIITSISWLFRLNSIILHSIIDNTTE